MPRWVTRRSRRGPVTEPIFDSVDEFNKYFRSIGEEPPKPLENWRDARQGDWVWTDDGAIIRVIRVSKMGNDKVILTIAGMFNASRRSTKMDSDPTKHPVWKTFSTKNPERRGYVVKKRDGFSVQDARFFKYILVNKMSIDEAYRKAYKASTYDSRDITRRLVKRLGDSVIMKVLTEDIRRACYDLGIDPAYILSKVKDLVEKSNSDAVKLGALKELMDIIGMKSEANEFVGGRVAIQSPIDDAEIAEIEAETARAISEGAPKLPESVEQ